MDKEIYTKDFPVRKDSFHCETFPLFLPILNRFLHFHIDNLLALSLVNLGTFSLQSPAQRQTTVRQVTTCYHEIQMMKEKKKGKEREKHFNSPSEAATLFGSHGHPASCVIKFFQFYFTLLETEKSRAVQCWLLTQLCSCPLFLSY